MRKKTFSIQYLVIPDFVFNNEKLTYMAAKVYAFIHNYRMPEFFYGNEKLMELFNCSEDTISRAIKILKDEGYITTKFDGRKRYIFDNYITHRVVKNDEADSADLRMLSQAKDSAETQTLPQANTAEVIRKDNKKSLGENFVGEEEFADKGWLEAKRQRKQNKGRGVFQGRGFPPTSSNTPRYEKKERSAAHGEDIV